MHSLQFNLAFQIVGTFVNVSTCLAADCVVGKEICHSIVPKKISSCGVRTPSKMMDYSMGD